MADNTDMIRAHNDAFRATFAGGRVYATRGVTGLGEEIAERVLRSVKTFDAFSEDNDPHGKHDFGAFDDADAGKVFWKIDYYDKSMKSRSPDPVDPLVTHRVLTIMLADEY